MLFYLSWNKLRRSLYMPDFRHLALYSLKTFAMLWIFNLLSTKYLELLNFRKYFLSTVFCTWIQILKPLRFLSHFYWYLFNAYYRIPKNPLSIFRRSSPLINMPISLITESLALSRTVKICFNYWFFELMTKILSFWKDSYLWLYSDLRTTDAKT